MSIIVKCPKCNVEVKLMTKPKYFFKHCNIAHKIEGNVIIESSRNIQLAETGKEMESNENDEEMVFDDDEKRV